MSYIRLFSMAMQCAAEGFSAAFRSQDNDPSIEAGNPAETAALLLKAAGAHLTMLKLTRLSAAAAGPLRLA